MKRLKWLPLIVLALTMMAACSSGGHAALEYEGKYRTYYEIFVRSYHDSDGDEIGDLNGLREKLDYVAALGVGGIWMMPVMPSPSYHKYDVMDYMSIDPQYGTLADFEALAEDCKERNLTLIVDLVLNHSSSQHPWFLSASQSVAAESCGEEVCSVAGLCRAHNPYCEYYHFSEEKQMGWTELPNGWYYQSVFDKGMPDLNLDCDALRGEIVEIMDFWLQKGADGFRLDAVTEFYNKDILRNTEFLTWLYDSAQALDPDVYMVGEAWTDAGSIGRYYESGIDSFFNFPFAQADGVINQSIMNADGTGLSRKIEDRAAYDAVFLSNHDMARSAGFLKGDKQKLAAAVYLWMPGNAFVYYGEEIGMRGSGRDENKRLPMLWDASDSEGMTQAPPNADQKQVLEEGVAQQEKDPDSLLNTYKHLIAVKRDNPVLARGTVTAIDYEGSVCSYQVTEGDQSLFIFHNLSEEAVTLSLSTEPGKQSLKAGNVPDGGKVTLRGYELTLPPLSSAILG